jgi:hypothetical protein
MNATWIWVESKSYKGHFYYVDENQKVRGEAYHPGGLSSADLYIARFDGELLGRFLSIDAARVAVEQAAT